MPQRSVKRSKGAYSSFVDQNAQIATNKGGELTLMCEELSPNLLVTEHGLTTAISSTSTFKTMSWKTLNAAPRPKTEEQQQL